MFKLMLLLSIVFTAFYLFLGSFLAQLLKDNINDYVISKFSDVLNMNPFLSPEEAVVGTLLSYFIVSSLMATLLSLSKELKEKGDVYRLEHHVKGGLLVGMLSLVIGGALRLVGAANVADLSVPLILSMFEARYSYKSAVLLLLIFLGTGAVLDSVIRYLVVRGVDTAPLYYILLLFLSPALVYFIRKTAR